MKSFFRMFLRSAQEFKSVRCITMTGILIAVSMIIEMYSIDLNFVKINFAFLAIAAVGMLFGPTVGLFAGLAGDVVGFLAHPTGPFLPIYVLVAGLQGLIYGVCLYHKNDSYSIKVKGKDITLYVRAVIARLIDVLFINLLLNTKLNMHYGFIPEQAFSKAIAVRAAKNALELVADIPLLFVILPAVLVIYKRMSVSERKTKSA